MVSALIILAKLELSLLIIVTAHVRVMFRLTKILRLTVNVLFLLTALYEPSASQNCSSLVCAQSSTTSWGEYIFYRLSFKDLPSEPAFSKFILFFCGIAQVGVNLGSIWFWNIFFSKKLSHSVPILFFLLAYTLDHTLFCPPGFALNSLLAPPSQPEAKLELCSVSDRAKR